VALASGKVDRGTGEYTMWSWCGDCGTLRMGLTAGAAVWGPAGAAEVAVCPSTRASGVADPVGAGWGRVGRGSYCSSSCGGRIL
jgi:hypothetical protein